MAETLTADQVISPWSSTTSIKPSDQIPFIPSSTDGTNSAQKITAELLAVYIWKMHPPKIVDGKLVYYDMSTGQYTQVGDFSEKSYTFEVDESKQLVEYINKGGTDEKKITICSLSDIFSDMMNEAKSYDFVIEENILYLYINKGKTGEIKVSCLKLLDIFSVDAAKALIRSDVYTVLTEDAYAALTTKDSNMLYMTVEE